MLTSYINIEELSFLGILSEGPKGPPVPDWISIPLVYTQVTASHLPSPSASTVCPVLCVTLRELEMVPAQGQFSPVRH